MIRDSRRFNEYIAQAKKGKPIDSYSDDGAFASVWYKGNNSKVIRVDYVHGDPFAVEVNGNFEQIRRS